MNTEEEKKVTEAEQTTENTPVTESTPAPVEAPTQAEQKVEANTEVPAPEEMPVPKEEAKAPEEGLKPTLGVGEVAPMTEEEKAAKLAAQAQNFNSQEKVVYKMKAEKDANPFGVILFFVVLIAFAFFLPKIVAKYGSIFEKKHNYFDTSSTVPSGEQTKEKEEEPEEQKDPELHSFADSTAIKKGDISFLNFVKSNNNGTYELAFSVMNDGDSIFDFSKKFYIEFYSGDVKVGEKLIHSYDSLAPKAATQFIIIINEDEYNNSNNYKIVEKTIEDYPVATLATSDGDYKTLKCVKDNNELVYYFKEDVLEIIYEDTKVPNNDPNYQEKLAQASQESASLREIEGIDSTVVETNQSGMDLKTTINLETVPTTTLTSLKQYKYFKYHEKASVVKYEAKGIGYTCS